MKKFLLILILFSVTFLFAQNRDRFEITPRQGGDRELVKGATVYIVHVDTGDSLQLTEYSGTRAGTYYRDNVPYGLYKIYVNETLVRNNYPFGVDRTRTFIEAVDSDGDNKIETAGIEDLAITVSKIADGAVTNSKLASSAVTNSKLSSASVTASKIADGTIINSKLGTSSVSTDKIANGAVTTAKLAESAITSDKVADSTLIKADLSPQLIQYIDASGGGTITNYPDGKTLNVNASNEMYADTTKMATTTYHLVSDTMELKQKDYDTGQFVYLQQISSLNPTGAGWFVVIDSTYPETYGGEVFAHPESGKQWVDVDYLSRKIVNVKKFGAIGDGITSDNTALTNAVSFADSGDIIELPPSSNPYVIGSGVALKSNIIVKSNGLTKVKGYFTLGDNVSKVKIKNLEFQKNTTGEWTYGVEVNGDNVRDVTIENCYFDDNQIIHSSGGYVLDNVTIRHCHFTFNASTVQALAVLQINAKNVTIEDCYFDVTNANSAIKMADGSENITITHCTFKGSYYQGSGEGDVFDFYQVDETIKITDCEFDISYGDIISYKPGTSSDPHPNPHNVFFTKNKVKHTGEGDAIIYCTGANTLSFDDTLKQSLTIENNQFDIIHGTSLMRIAGLDFVNVNHNIVKYDYRSSDPVLQLTANQNTIVNGNIFDSGYIYVVYGNTSAGDAYDTLLTNGSFTFTNNQLNDPYQSEYGALYIYNQDGLDVIIAQNIFHLTETNTNKTLYFKKCDFKSIIISDNISQAIRNAVATQNGTYFNNCTYDVLKENDNSWN